ncbi:hypothetical protein [Salinigranum marinum]|uniref:hypothetical protein n=1 Tax=Salinigranum marinum TaxID=1515595 RepID=UPI00298A078C|nr:hypothetical protein [Salinigranum marinum]
MTDVDTSAVRDSLVESHPGVVDAVRTCAAAAAAAVTTDAGRTDTSAVRREIESRLRSAGVWGELPSVLADCVERTGRRFRATPVAAPPYVAPTATGVVLRATLDGGRLVVAVDALSIERERADGTGTGVELRPRPPETPRADLVRVEWRS